MPVFLLDVSGDITGRAQMRPVTGLGAMRPTRLPKTAAARAGEQEAYLARMIASYKLPPEVVSQLKSVGTEEAIKILVDISKEQEATRKFTDSEGKSITRDQANKLSQMAAAQQFQVREAEARRDIQITNNKYLMNPATFKRVQPGNAPIYLLPKIISDPDVKVAPTLAEPGYPGAYISEAVYQRWVAEHAKLSAPPAATKVAPIRVVKRLPMRTPAPTPAVVTRYPIRPPAPAVVTRYPMRTPIPGRVDRYAARPRPVNGLGENPAMPWALVAGGVAIVAYLLARK